METRLLASAHYDQADAREVLTRAFIANFNNSAEQPVFICIGSDRHLLDCLGPLTGTMLQEQGANVLVFGTLHDPWHAGNLSLKLRELRVRFPYHPAVAIDASIGDSEPPGLIKLKTGAIKPGKAVQKNLPKVGDFAITGLVGNREKQSVSYTPEIISLAHVYSMSRVISQSIIEWKRRRQGDGPLVTDG